MSIISDNINNDSHYHRRLNSVEQPICAGKGFSCPALYSAIQLLSYFTTLADLIFIPLLVYISFAKVKDSIFKYFTLNLMAVCSMLSIADLVVDGVNIASLFINLDGNRKNLYRIQHWAQQCLSAGDVWYHGLALYATIVCYLPYSKPIFFAEHFVKRGQKAHYATLHVFLFIWNVSLTFLKKQYSFNILFHLTHIILFIALFTVAVMASIKIYKYQPSGTKTYDGKIRRKRLVSFIVYSYTTEIIVLPRFISSLVEVICIWFGCQRQFKRTKFSSTIHLMLRIFYESCSVAISASTIIALQPYRHAIRLMLRRRNSST